MFRIPPCISFNSWRLLHILSHWGKKMFECGSSKSMGGDLTSTVWCIGNMLADTGGRLSPQRATRFIRQQRSGVYSWIDGWAAGPISSLTALCCWQEMVLGSFCWSHFLPCSPRFLFLPSPSCSSSPFSSQCTLASWPHALICLGHVLPYSCGPSIMNNSVIFTLNRDLILSLIEFLSHPNLVQAFWEVTIWVPQSSLVICCSSTNLILCLLQRGSLEHFHPLSPQNQFLQMKGLAIQVGFWGWLHKLILAVHNRTLTALLSLYITAIIILSRPCRWLMPESAKCHIQKV